MGKKKLIRSRKYQKCEMLRKIIILFFSLDGSIIWFTKYFKIRPLEKTVKYKPYNDTIMTN